MKSQPGEFVLSQNYLNHFNPGIVINYTIHSVEICHSVSIQLIIYDAYVNEITTFAKGIKIPGYREFQLDAADLSSKI